MKPTLFIFCAVLGALLAVGLLQLPAESQVAGGFLALQAATPGTAQSGHANMNGTMRAGQFVGGGAGLSGVNADLLDGLDSTAFLQSIPVPLSLLGSVSGTGIISGVNTATTSNSSGVYGGASGAAGDTNGVRGISASVTGRGVSGEALASTGVNFGGRFQSDSSAGRAVFGLASAASGTTYGAYFQANSPNGIGVYSVTPSTVGGTAGYFDHNAVGGYAVFGISRATTGNAIAGYFANQSTDGRAVNGFCDATSGVTTAGYFQSSSTSGRAVFGLVSSATGTTYAGRFQTNSSTGRGVSGEATASGATDVPYGIRGSCSTLSLGYGVYAVGDSGASGTKSFRIDHPFDPANKYLLHYSSESPFPQNFYNGTVVTDANGYAWVQLPDYFAEINTNFKYQLTVVGKTFAQAIVSEEIADNRFQIHTSKGGVKVSWEVKADRNDLRIRRHRPTDVREKIGPERGKYQHPEYYNLPASMGMDSSPESDQKVGELPSRPR